MVADAASASSRLRRWAFVHKWSSLVATAFLLMLCITGLPLVFKAEIERALDPMPPRPAAAPAGNPASLDAIVARHLASHPGETMLSLGFRPADGIVFAQSAVPAAAPATPSPRPSAMQAFDLRSGLPVEVAPPGTNRFMAVMEALHTELYAGLPGALFLGVMALTLVAAVVSGVVLYAPFMRRLDFGTVRRASSSRLRWLDLHNLLGIVTTAWLLVVAVTGAINTLHDPVAAGMRQRFVDLATSYRNAPPPGHLGSLDAAIAAARAGNTDTSLVALWFPGTRFSTPHHYAVFQRGVTPLTARMLTAALVDAETSVLTDRPDMPWYAKALFVSQPLHFGDYGGLPLKVIWALLDLLTIVVLGSGLYLWFDRR